MPGLGEWPWHTQGLATPKNSLMAPQGHQLGNLGTSVRSKVVPCRMGVTLGLTAPPDSWWFGRYCRNSEVGQGGLQHHFGTVCVSSGVGRGWAGASRGGHPSPPYFDPSEKHGGIREGIRRRDGHDLAPGLPLP